MTERVSPKLLVLLTITVVAAGFGARSLLGNANAVSESGFDGEDLLPLSTASVDGAVPLVFVPPLDPRNPFLRSDGVSIERDAIEQDEGADPTDTVEEPVSEAIADNEPAIGSTADGNDNSGDNSGRFSELADDDTGGR